MLKVTPRRKEEEEKDEKEVEKEVKGCPGMPRGRTRGWRRYPARISENIPRQKV